MMKNETHHPQRMTNVRCSDGLVHSCELEPKTHPANDAHVTKAGYTWCMMFFTWRDGPRFYPLEDGAEYRLERTDAHVTCFRCIAGELGADAYTLL
jgi:hypothetical protein